VYVSVLECFQNGKPEAASFCPSDRGRVRRTPAGYQVVSRFPGENSGVDWTQTD
jgi:hypothetical protein